MARIFGSAPPRHRQAPTPQRGAGALCLVPYAGLAHSRQIVANHDIDADPLLFGDERLVTAQGQENASR